MRPDPTLHRSPTPQSNQTWDMSGVRPQCFIRCISYTALHFSKPHEPRFHLAVSAVNKVVTLLCDKLRPLHISIWLGTQVSAVFADPEKCAQFGLELLRGLRAQAFMLRVDVKDKKEEAMFAPAGGIHAGPVFSYFDQSHGRLSFAGRHMEKAYCVSRMAKDNTVLVSSAYAALLACRMQDQLLAGGYTPAPRKIPPAVTGPPVTEPKKPTHTRRGSTNRRGHSRRESTARAVTPASVSGDTPVVTPAPVKVQVPFILTSLGRQFLNPHSAWFTYEHSSAKAVQGDTGAALDEEEASSSGYQGIPHPKAETFFSLTATPVSKQ